MDAGRIATSAEMRLVLPWSRQPAFSINELQKRLHFVEEKVGAFSERDIQNCLATKKKTLTTKLLKVISGGQTGVDRGALDARWRCRLNAADGVRRVGWPKMAQSRRVIR